MRSKFKFNQILICNPGGLKVCADPNIVSVESQKHWDELLAAAKKAPAGEIHGIFLNSAFR